MLRHVRSEIEQAAKIALEAQAPEELLVERLAEGAAKGVPPATLQRAMEEEADTLAASQRSLISACLVWTRVLGRRHMRHGCNRGARRHRS